ncbi:MAG TPA: HAMP domain-containing histidine kinase [Sulfurospirillum arcachonense]|nr:HAMP domain-containing histidine kinase [Sulfurospirillum arcachonense]
MCKRFIYIDIEDNGGGVKEENLHKVFQPYFTTKDEHNGTGLEFYMSKTLAQKHLNGDLRVKNSEHGAIFTISIRKTS